MEMEREPVIKQIGIRPLRDGKGKQEVHGSADLKII